MAKSRVEWSDLPTELWSKIAKSLHNHIDILRFRSVCKSWRSLIPPNSPSFPLQIPHPLKKKKKVFLTHFTFYKIEPPHNYKTPSKAWMIKLEEESDSPKSKSESLRLIHPLSDCKPQYPPSDSSKVLNFLHYRVSELFKSYRIKNFGGAVVKKVLFFPSSCWSDMADSVACCIYFNGKLGILRYGSDKKWTILDDDNKNFDYDDIILYKGQFYATDKWGTISWVDPWSLKLVQYSPPLCGFGHKKHLVESCGNLYVVDMYYDSDPRRINEFRDVPAVVDFKVYRLDEEWGKWVYVKNLEDRVFVLSESGCCFSVSAEDFDGCQGNRIFFTDDNFDVRVFNFGDRSIFNINSKFFWPPPSWLAIT